MLINMTLKDFIDELKSDSPAPGGGSAAALAGAIGAALAIMVGNLTSRNDKYQAVHAQAQALQDSLEEQLDCLEMYVDEDTAAFNRVMAAYRLPKATDEEKAVRSQEIQTAMQQAALLPMNVAAVAREVLTMSLRMLEIGNSNAASDAAVAGRMAYTAMWGAIYNVRINLGAIKDQAFVLNMRKQMEELLVKAEKDLELLVKEADNRIGV
jgi:methenyltetrahydrofolate cyclohydrolase